MSKRFWKAGDGMVYTNGTIAAPCIFLARDEDKENWQETTDTEAVMLQAAEEQDYLEALKTLGVIV